MQESYHIRTVAVLGAGVMGAQIAAHCANAGFKTLLFDLPQVADNRNELILKAIKRLEKLKPAPLGSKQVLSAITACNYDDDLNRLADCDLVIEAIAEKLDWKEALYQKIAPHLAKHSILVTNTSGLSINQLAKVIPASHATRFCGVHFFNPPRYMHLAELIPAEKTAAACLNYLETWLTRYLGKGVIRAKDTPNFIANRVGVFSLLVTLHHAERLGLGLDTVDALTGSLLGRPKSATCRTMDVVGLDTMVHVVNTMTEQLADDPWHALFNMPDWLNQMIASGHLGQKSKQGIYRKQGKVIEVFDTASGEYRPADTTISAEVSEIMAVKDPQKRCQRLLESNDKQAQFIQACLLDTFHYAAYHLADIAESARDIDKAMCWGFGWSQGPFETWQAMGFEAILKHLQDNPLASVNVTLPKWVEQVDKFYKSKTSYSAEKGSFVTPNKLPVYQRQLTTKSMTKHFETDAVCLSAFDEQLAVVQFKTKANTIGQAVLDDMQEVLAQVEREFAGLIVYQDNPNLFSAGANIVEIAALVKDKQYNKVDDMLSQFQNLLMRMRYASFPVVAALRGRALGGGCELLLHCDVAVSAFESYPGLVEAAIGVIPAGGGCKEMARRAAHIARGKPLMPYLQPYFQNIAMCHVAGSANEAMQAGYLRRTDKVIMHAEEVLFAAAQLANYLLETNYTSPLMQDFPIAGREGLAVLRLLLVNWKEGGFISDHDYFLADQLAAVICGGDLPQGTMVNESWLLKLEREAFLALVQTPETQAKLFKRAG